MIASILGVLSSLGAALTALLGYFKKTEEAQAESDAASIEKTIQTEETTGRPE